MHVNVDLATGVTTLKNIKNKKAFQSNANHPLANIYPGHIVNNCEHVWGGGGGQGMGWSQGQARTSEQV